MSFKFSDCEDATDVAELLKETNNNRNVNVQKTVSGDLTLCGFFEFKTGNDKKKGKPFCFMTGVSRLNVLEFVKQAGYRKRYHKNSQSYTMIQAHNNIMEPVTIDIIRVHIYSEMLKLESLTVFHEMDWTFSKELAATIYLKNQDQIFNKNFLELMDEYTVPELKDTRSTSYFLFSDGIIEVMQNQVNKIPFEHLWYLDMCVWKSHIMNREYTQMSSLGVSEFEKFILNAAGNEIARINAFKSALGYLLHNYNGSHMGQAVVCYDEKPTDVRNPQGGTGKGLFVQGVAHMREVAKIDGKHFKADDKFRFQTVQETSQVVNVDDLPKEVSFEIFFSCLTEGFTIEKKHQPTIKLEPEDSPKMVFSMNTIINGNGSSHRRRMFVIEFSDHYSSKIKTGHEHPIEDEHGVLFDRIEWSQQQWDAFTSFMIDCLSYYLKNGLQPYELINVGKNTLIQTTGEDFAEWVNEQNFEVGIYYSTKKMFEAFRFRFYGAESEYKQRTFTNNIKKYADTKGWDCKIVTDAISKKSEFTFDPKT